MNTLEVNKALVRRLVDEVINAGDMDLLDELFAPELAPRMRRLFGSFRSAFPDCPAGDVSLGEEADPVAPSSLLLPKAGLDWGYADF